MSRSYKKNEYCQIVCNSAENIRDFKRIENRSFRRKLKAGELDDLVDFGKTTTIHKKMADFSFEYDYFTRYYSEDEYGDCDWFIQNGRK